MLTIFNGLDYLNNEQICEQIALLQCVTVGNTLKGQGKKAWKMVTETASSLLRPVEDLSDSSSSTEETDGVRKMIMDTMEELSKNDRATLDALLNQELIKKCKFLGSYHFFTDTLEEHTSSEGEEGPSSMTMTTDLARELLREQISIAVLRESAKVYMLDVCQPMGRLADQVSVKYYDHYLKVLHRKLLHLTRGEKQAMEQSIQMRIPRCDLTAMRTLARELMLREFNGHTILLKLQVDKGTTSLRKVIHAMGKEVFDPLNNTVATAFDSVFLFARLERSLMAEVVWMSVNGYGKTFSLKEDLMPSYKAYKRNENEKKERSLLTFVQQEKQQNDVLKKILAELEKDNKKQFLLEEQQTKLLSELEELQKEYEEVLSSEEFSEAGKLAKKRNLERKQVAEVNLSMELEEVKLRINNKQNELVSTSEEFNRLILDLENEAVYLANVLYKKWKRHFLNLTYSEALCENAVKCFTNGELIKLEEALTELDAAMTPSSLSFEHSPEDMDYLHILVSAGKYARVGYQGFELKTIEIKK